MAGAQRENTGASSGITVRGLRELQILFAAAGKEANRDLRAELRSIAEPIQADAELLALQEIPRIGVKWSRMRIGVTRRVVYVAPRQRGVKTRGPDPRRRPNLATLLAERVMGPALERNEAMIEQRTAAVFDRLAVRWNRKG